MTIRALNKGKHVMCDKPTGITATDASTMQQAAVRAGKVYATMCHQRSYASHRKVKELIDAGAVGEVERASLIDTESLRTRYYHQSSSWRSSWTREGGGLLINQGHHLLDFWLWLFGAPESLYADIPYGKYNSFMVDDEATLVLDYPGRMTGTIILSTGEGGITQRLEIAGTRGRILLDGNTLTLTRFGQDIRAYAGSAQVTSRQELSTTTEEYVFGSDEHAYEIMLNNFGAAIRGEAPLIAPGRDGIATLEIINAAYLSAWEGRRLRLPVDGQQYLLVLQKHEKLEQAKCDGA
jgi:predicted dehydrogenase